MSFITITAPKIEVEINEKQYTLSPITLGDLAEYIVWLQYQPWEIFKKTSSGLSSETKKELEKEVYLRCRDNVINLEDESVSKSMQTPSGAIRLLYFSIKKDHPDLSYDMVSDMISIYGFDELLNKLLSISGLSGPESIEDKVLGEF